MPDRGPPTPNAGLFNEAFLTRLEQLVLAGRKLYAGSTSGQRRSTRIGDGVEFADHRAYFPGDDLRYIDWNVYARTERLLLRLFHEEADLLVHLILDTSASMAMGSAPNARRRRRRGSSGNAGAALSEPTSKFDHARRIAAALGHLSLANLDRVAVWTASDAPPRSLPVIRGMAQRNRLLEFLAATRPAGRADLARTADTLAARRAGRGVAVLLSDFIDVGDLARALDRLRFAGIDCYAVQVLAPEEIDPPYRGRVDLTDAETAEATRFRVTPELRAAYLTELAERFEALERLCAAREALLVRTVTTDAFERLILRTFRLAGLLQ